MNATGTITMTMREVDRFKVIQAVTEARLKPGHAGNHQLPGGRVPQFPPA